MRTKRHSWDMITKNKNAFQKDAYHLLQWSSRGKGGLPRGGVCLGRCQPGGICLGGVCTFPPPPTHGQTDCCCRRNDDNKNAFQYDVYWPLVDRMLQSASWGVWSGDGFSLAGGGSPWQTPPVNRMTDRCKNITLATTSLRPVITEMFLLVEFGGPGSGPLRHLSKNVKSDWTCRNLMNGKGIDLESGQTCATTEHSKDAVSNHWRI